MQRFSYQVDNTKIAIAVAKFRGKFPSFIKDWYSFKLPIDERKINYEEDRVHFARAKVREGTSIYEVMFQVRLEAKQLHISQIPGVHDVTGRDNDAFLDFMRIISCGFSGGGYCNTAFLGPDPVSRFREFEYTPLVTTGKNPESTDERFRGDRYRLLLWSGFTGNFSSRLTSIAGAMMSEGNVFDCPVKHIDSFVLLPKDLTEMQLRARIAAYQAEFSKTGAVLPKFLFRGSYEAVPDNFLVSP